MTTFTSKSGKKQSLVTKGINGYGQTVYRAKYMQLYSDGEFIQEDLIEMKEYKKESTAINWAKKQVQ